MLALRNPKVRFAISRSVFQPKLEHPRKIQTFQFGADDVVLRIDDKEAEIRQKSSAQMPSGPKGRPIRIESAANSRYFLAAFTPR